MESLDRLRLWLMQRSIADQQTCPVKLLGGIGQVQDPSQQYSATASQLDPVIYLYWLCVDVDGSAVSQAIDKVFQSTIRPDLVIYDASKVAVLELTVSWVKHF